MEALHLTPAGRGSGATRAERRAAWALVDENIRHELAERHANHWPRHRRSARRVLAARVAARRRRLVVITDSDLPTRRVIVAATCRSSSTRFGRVAAVPLRFARMFSNGTVVVATMVVLLAFRHGHIGIGALGAASVCVALLAAPIFVSLRLRLSDRVLAGRARLLVPECRDELASVMVLHQLSYPRSVTGTAEAFRDAELAAQALRTADELCFVARPCCVELAQLYSSQAGTSWLPAHARVDRTVLVFSTSDRADNEAPDNGAAASIAFLDAFRSKVAKPAALEPV